MSPASCTPWTACARTAGGPLGEGALHGSTLVCPWHAWEFDCRTGANDFDPDVTVATFPVKIEAGEILIDDPLRRSRRSYHARTS